VCEGMPTSTDSFEVKPIRAAKVVHGMQIFTIRDARRGGKAAFRTFRQVLGMIVVIRTFLSFTLEVELEGRWPWHRALAPRS
jgi:uncharacterized membrane protein